MKFGLFMMPVPPAGTEHFDSHQWDLQYLTLCDELGFEEAWIGEHFTSPWEPIPAPDLLIAQALMQTNVSSWVLGRTCCLSIIRRNWRTGLPTWITCRRAGSCSAWEPADSPVTGSCSMWTAPTACTAI